MTFPRYFSVFQIGCIGVCLWGVSLQDIRFGVTLHASFLLFLMSRDSLLVQRWTSDPKVVSFNPSSSRSGGRIFFSRVNFVYWLLYGVRFNSVLLQWHVKDWPFHQKCRWQVADYAAIQA